MRQRRMKMSKKEQLEVGKIVNTHGIKGGIKVVPYTDDPADFEIFNWVYIKKNDGVDKRTINRVQYQKNNVILYLEGIGTIEEGEKHKNCVLLIDRDMAIPLPDNVYYISDLIGIEVRTEEGEKLGKICNVFPTGSNDVYVVKHATQKKEILLPAIREVVKQIDIESGTMVINLIEGLIEE